MFSAHLNLSELLSLLQYLQIKGFLCVLVQTTADKNLQQGGGAHDEGGKSEEERVSGDICRERSPKKRAVSRQGALYQLLLGAGPGVC